ncbi:Stf0 family sulfotransferase [Paenibacillus sp. R14(2021)]|uniref:Stf0 family sulfotransferase n=1 Tax=Paenibacillus sp. R14(2021) TaxID=2859228 RepID=UPI001C613CFA|nr:Stf0 family sulfotransferase [Paenibacillus sp. R14(2021)]
MRPKLSYTIWFSQRTGSTLLQYALASTGAAGNPGEWMHGRNPETITEADVETMWEAGTTPNGIFGVKTSLNNEWIHAFRRLYDFPDSAPAAAVWRAAFPNCTKHIYMTRRNKVRLAVSWWRAIVSGEWHRMHGAEPSEQDITGKYNFDAIQHLLTDCALREAAMDQFLAEEGIVPLTLVYEDFILDYEGTVRKVLAFLGVSADDVTIAPPAFDRLADEINEQWVQRFRQERQQDWERAVW